MQGAIVDLSTFFWILRRTQFHVHAACKRLRYEMSLWKCWAVELTNEFWRGYTSHLGLGCISRFYRRLEISLPGRCSPKPRPLARLPSCILYISRGLSWAEGTPERKMLSAEHLILTWEFGRPRSSLRVMANTSCCISNCAPGIRIMFLNFGVSCSSMRIVG